MGNLRHMKNKSIYILPAVVVAIVAIVAFCKASGKSYQKDSGFVFGTSYNITYESDKSLKDDITCVLDSVNNSLSPFNEKSIISDINNNKSVNVDRYFTEVFNLSKEVNKATDGAFDITVAPLVNVWGFGFKEGKFPTAHEVDSLRALVGLNKVTLIDGKIQKEDPRIMLDCSAIAKGYAVDKVGEMLARHGVQNYLVEIGGEIVSRGMNSRGKEWKIGVTKPVDDSLSVNSENQTVVTVSNSAMATSGNYRNYYIKDGHKYAHTIDPKTGYPAENDMLSATVFAKTCAEADAYATGFMTMGSAKAKALAEKLGIKCYLITNKGAFWVNEK